MNQCDGCRRGLPIDSERIHHNPSDVFDWDGLDMIVCTQDMKKENSKEEKS